jgi:hypothetical protein
LRLSPFLLSPPTILGLDISYLEIDILSIFLLFIFVFSIPWFLLYFEGYSTPLLPFSSAYYSNYLFLS